jgi:hypothetical protein
MAENRRLAAIMAVDVIGYSRLMSDEESGATNMNIGLVYLF